MLARHPLTLQILADAVVMRVPRFGPGNPATNGGERRQARSLMSYGNDLVDQYRQAASYVDRIPCSAPRGARLAGYPINTVGRTLHMTSNKPIRFGCSKRQSASAARDCANGF